MAAKKDFFISYNKADARMAEWIAWQLEDAGYSVVIEAWDFRPGGDFVREMDEAIKDCARGVAVLSGAYVAALYTQSEWQAYFAQDPTGDGRKLVPVRVGEYPAEGLLAQIIYIDLLGRDEKAAKTVLLEGVQSGRRKPAQSPPFHPRPAPQFPASTSPAASAGLARHQLPPLSAVFIGREAEEKELLALLRGGQAAGAAISGSLQGMGGVGKTTLAVVLAHQLAERYPAAQLYRDLRGADPEHRQPLTPAEVMRDFIVALRPDAGQLPEELEPLGRIYRSVLSEAGRVLLLLDNTAGAEQVRPLLPPAGCLLLVTSRQHITLPGLVVRDLDCLAPEKAAELLLRLAPRAAGHAAEAAQLCGGLPLAIEVFAGAINDESLTPVPELLARLRAGVATLSKVEAAFAVSESLLPEETRTAWHLLSIFTASFDLPAAAAVWEKETAAARATLQVLVNASLVEFNADNARFRLHDLARQFCDRPLSEAQREETRFHHAKHYLGVSWEADGLYKEGGDRVVVGLLLFDRERTHVEAAFTWLKTREDALSAELLVSLVEAVAYVGDLRFHPRQRIAWLEAQSIAARLAGDRESEGNAVGNLGIGYRNLGDARRAIDFYEQQLVIVLEIGDRRGEGAALGNLGNAYYDLGEAPKAIEFHEQALVVLRAIGNRRAEGNVLGNLGSAHAELATPARLSSSTSSGWSSLARSVTGEGREMSSAISATPTPSWATCTRASSSTSSNGSSRSRSAIGAGRATPPSTWPPNSGRPGSGRGRWS
jgi:tetratricopeptide (TPR) repeat protein